MSTQSLESGNNLENLNQKVGSPITTDLPSPNEKEVPISKGALPNNGGPLKKNPPSPNKEEGEKLVGQVEKFAENRKVIDDIANQNPNLVSAAANPLFDIVNKEFVPSSLVPKIKEVEAQTNEQLDEEAKKEGPKLEKVVQDGVNSAIAAVPFVGAFVELTETAGDLINAVAPAASSTMKITTSLINAEKDLRNELVQTLEEHAEELTKPFNELEKEIDNKVALANKAANKLGDAAQEATNTETPNLTDLSKKSEAARIKRRLRSGGRKKKNTEKIMRRIARTMRSFQRPKHRRTKRKRNNVRRTRRK